MKKENMLKALLQSSEQKLSAMVKGGTAATSDYENVRAERLSVANAVCVSPSVAKSSVQVD